MAQLTPLRSIARGAVPPPAARPLGEPAFTVVVECPRCLDGTLPEHAPWHDSTGWARWDCPTCCQTGKLEVRGKRIHGEWRAIARPAVDPRWPAYRDARLMEIATCRTEQAARSCWGPAGEHDADVIVTEDVRPHSWEHAVVLRELGLEVGRG